MSDHKTSFLKPLRNKIIAALLLAMVAIGLAVSIMYYSFESLLVTVDELTLPNQKIATLNNLFHRIAELDQRQRAQAIQNPRKAYVQFLNESKELLASLDTLRSMEWSHHDRLQRIDEMEDILHQRDKLFLSYLKVKSEFILNKKLSQRLDTLTKIISSSHEQADTNVTTTQKRTTTTTYLPQKPVDDRSLFSRLFSKKKSSPTEEVPVKVLEELSIKVDTISIAIRDSAIAEVSSIMKSLEKDQRLQNRQMFQGELQLISTNNALISQLLNTLRQVEKEEENLLRSNSAKATTLVNDSIKRIGIILILFFLGASILSFFMLIDITKSNQLRHQLVQAKDEAERLSQIKQRFLANMSHEIRTPLQSILGFSEQLKSSASENKEAIEAIQRSSDHLLHIINEVLDYSRLEFGKLSLEKEPFYLLDVVKEIESIIRIQAEKKNLSLIFDIDELKNVRLLGDAFRLRQILYNLLGNAIKFTSTGYVKLVSEMNDLGYTVRCRFHVIDTGIGMLPQDIDRAFLQFEQANSAITRNYGGTGLGLTIVKKLVEAHFGTIHVQSEIGKGSTFSVELVFDKAPFDKKKNKHQPSEPLLETPPREVLVVDDDPMILRLCTIMLEKHGINHTAFNRADKALEHPLDGVSHIMLDIRMPDINGIDLCAKLRKKIKHPVKIIALTAHVLPQERSDLLAQGFDYVLPKPFREKELVTHLGIKINIDLEEPVSPSNFSFTKLKELTMNDEQLLHSVLIQFLEETRDDLVQLEDLIIRKNMNGIREIIHKLAGRTGQIGFDDLSGRLRAMEKQLVGGASLTEISAPITDAISELQNILTQIQQQEVNS